MTTDVRPMCCRRLCASLKQTSERGERGEQAGPRWVGGRLTQRCSLPPPERGTTIRLREQHGDVLRLEEGVGGFLGWRPPRSLLPGQALPYILAAPSPPHIHLIACPQQAQENVGPVHSPKWGTLQPKCRVICAPSRPYRICPPPAIPLPDPPLPFLQPHTQPMSS